MTNFEKVKRIISTYQADADRHFANYKAKEAHMRRTYSSEGFLEFFTQGVYPKFAGEAQANADIAIKQINDVFSDIENDLRSYMIKPLDASAAQILDCINRFELKLSKAELEVIELSVKDSYLGSRILEKIAWKNGYHVDVPKMEQLQRAIKSVRSNATLAIRAYAGSPDDKFIGRDLLPKWEKDGLVLGDYGVTHMLYACDYLQKGELDRLEKMFSEARAPMVYRLTEDEAEKVEKGVESILHDGEIDKKAVHDLLKKEPDFPDKLSSMTDKFFEDKEVLISYFGLDKKEESFESRIDPETQKAAECGPKFSKIDPKTLSNFS